MFFTGQHEKLIGAATRGLVEEQINDWTAANAIAMLKNREKDIAQMMGQLVLHWLRQASQNPYLLKLVTV